MIEIREGDLLASGLPIIAHGCNAQGYMGAGIAAQIRKKYPEVYDQYQDWISRRTPKCGEIQITIANDGTCIANLLTQPVPGPQARYGAIVTCFHDLFEWMTEGSETEVGIPRIGSGIGGLDQGVVEWLIKELNVLYPKIDVIIYELPQRDQGHKETP